MGHNLGHIDLLLNFGIFSMFPEWLQLQTSNLVCSSLTHSTIYKCKTRSQGSKTRSRDNISNLQTAVNNSETAKATGFLFSM